MKKILATLLVATMLLSCMTFVSFAADYEIYTLENFGFADLTYTAGRFGNSFNDEYTAAYYNYLSSVDMNADYTFNAPLAKALDTALYGGAAPASYAVTKGDYVALPIYVKSVGAVSVNVKWNPEYFTFKKVEGSYNAANKDLDEVNGVVNFNGFNSAGEDVTGLYGVVYFAVNDVTVLEGDAEGKATAAITVNPLPGEVTSATGAEAVLTTGSMNVDLYGLKEKAPVVTKPSLADEATIAAIEDTFTAFVPSGALVEGLEGDAFAAVFGTFDAAAYAEKVVDYGFYYVAGSTELRNADKSVKTDDGKFGCIFYGTKWAIENGEAVFYVTYETAEGETVTVYAD